MRTLRWGSHGDDVRQLQDGLRKHAFLHALVDGCYGAETRNAVAVFQRASGLPSDGIADALTQDALFPSPRVKRPRAVPPARRSVPEEL